MKKIEDGSSTQSSYATNSPKSFHYPWCQSFTYDAYDAYLIEAHLIVEMPTLKITTPFGNIPSKYLYKHTYVLGNKGRLIWKPFIHKDICTHVPYISTDANAIKYDHPEDTNVKSLNARIDFIKHFIAKSIPLFESVDNSNIVKDDQKYNCVTRENGTELYVLPDDRLLKFNPNKNLPGVVHHVHASFNSIKTTTDGSIVSKDLVNSHPSHIMSTNINELRPLEPINSTTLGPSQKNIHNIDHEASKLIDAINKISKANTSFGSATPAEVTDYNLYIVNKIQKMNNAKASFEF